MNYYSSGRPICPKRPGKRDTQYAKSIYLPETLPLEVYDKIIVLFSGGKDSLASLLHLLEMGVPESKIELWHHDIDGHHPTRKMDWPVTSAYVKAVADYLGIKLRTSWRVNGFWGEVYRLGASWPIQYEDNGQVMECRQSDRQQRSAELRERALDDMRRQELTSMGERMKFPAKSGNLAVRWCSSILKITVADSVLYNLDLDELRDIGQRGKFPAKSGCHQGRWCSGSLKAQVESGLYSNVEGLSQNIKLLIVSGERREESAGRSKYNEMEIHRANATARAHRLVHQWRKVIDWSESEIWGIIERWHIAPHPCYAAGWSRCSCAMCIFSLPTHWAGLRELFPNWVAEVEEDERTLGFTLDNKKRLNDYIGAAVSCVCRDDAKALCQLVNGEFSAQDVYKTEWRLPAGAFKGTGGGPC